MFYHFEEAEPNSNNERCLLRRVLRFTDHAFARNLKDSPISQENFMKVASTEFGESIMQEFEHYMEHRKNSRFVIVLDGMDKVGFWVISHEIGKVKTSTVFLLNKPYYTKIS